MERISFRICVFVASLFYFCYPASAIQCYECNSNFMQNCGFNGQALNESYLVQCDANATLCRKIDIYVDFKSATNGLGPQERMVRQCGHDQTGEQASYFTSGYGGEETVLTCGSDACNSAIGVSGNCAIRVSLFSVLFLMFRIFK